jgi:hypothetical protein
MCVNVCVFVLFAVQCRRLLTLTPCAFHLFSVNEWLFTSAAPLNANASFSDPWSTYQTGKGNLSAIENIVSLENNTRLCGDLDDTCDGKKWWLTTQSVGVRVWVVLLLCGWVAGVSGGWCVVCVRTCVRTCVCMCVCVCVYVCVLSE